MTRRTAQTITSAVRGRTLVAAMLLVLALVSTMAGCGGLRSRDAETVSYLLRAPAVDGAAAAAPAGAVAVAAASAESAGSASSVPPVAALAATTLQVLRVVAQPGYASDRILLLGVDRSLGYFASSRWADALPAVVGTLAVETLRGRGALRAVHDEFAPFAADYTLRLTIRRFDAEYPQQGQPPRVVVSLECTLGRRADRSTVASFVVQAQAEAVDQRMRDVVAAFEQASQQALGAAATQTLAALAADAVTAASAR